MPRSPRPFFNTTNGFGCSFCRDSGYEWRNHCLVNEDGKIVCPKSQQICMKNIFSEHLSCNSNTFVYYQSLLLKQK